MTFSRLIFAGLLVAAGTYTGCGGIAIIDGEAGASSSSGNGGASSSSSSSVGAGGAGASVLHFELVSALGLSNCMPVVPPDPLKMKITVRVVNDSSNSVGLSIAGGRLNSSLGALSFEVAPNNLVIAPNAKQELNFKKVDASAAGDNACQLCDTTDTMLELDLLTDGVPSVFAAPLTSMSCVY